ncbi:MAG TPA: hypothetical protein DEA96_11520 [Leptospiraceae bacterium]|nr:hypothetical protein [Spirochaetaceae bacterium]HBS05589.1 hypothetical protein [Leptospiraceae bacterium]
MNLPISLFILLPNSEVKKVSQRFDTMVNGFRKTSCPELIRVGGLLDYYYTRSTARAYSIP